MAVSFVLLNNSCLPRGAGGNQVRLRLVFHMPFEVTISPNHFILILDVRKCICSYLYIYLYYVYIGTVVIYAGQRLNYKSLRVEEELKN